MQTAHHRTQHALRFQFSIITIKNDQIMQIERHLRFLLQTTIAGTGRQITVAQGSVDCHLIEIEIHAGISQCPGFFRATGMRNHRFAQGMFGSSMNNLAQHFRNSRNGKRVTHRAPPLRLFR